MYYHYRMFCFALCLVGDLLHYHIIPTEEIYNIVSFDAVVSPLLEYKE